MQAEIRAVRDKLLEWSADHESWEVRMWCNIVARELDLLTRDPGNLALRQQTAAKIKQLGMATGRAVTRPIHEVGSRRPKASNCKTGSKSHVQPQFSGGFEVSS